jgi:hypothetical protein
LVYPCCSLKIYGRSYIRSFLRKIIPYSIVKREQAKLVSEKMLPFLDAYFSRGRNSVSTKKIRNLRILEFSRMVDRLSSMKSWRPRKYTANYYRKKLGYKLKAEDII